MDYFKEYQGVCPIVWIGSPTPSPSSECGSPPTGPRGGATLACVGRGGGPNSDDWTDTLVLFV
jgi:hypothetical protein